MSTDRLIVERPVIKRHHSQHWRGVLFKRSPLCAWCGVLTIPHGQTGVITDTTTTLDHVKSRPECRTVNEYRAQSNMRIACHACNRRRDREYHHLHHPGRNRFVKLPRRVLAHTLTAFDRPVASWRY